MKPTYQHYTPTRSRCVQPDENAQAELSPSCRILVEDYLAWKRSYTKSAARSYRNWVVRFQAFIQKPPEEIVIGDVSKFLIHVRQQFAEKNVQFGMHVIRNYLRFYNEQQRLRMPLYFVKIPRARTNSHRAVTHDECAKMLDLLSAQPQSFKVSLLACLISLLADTGLRIGELASLDLGDFGPELSAIVKTEKNMSFRRFFWTERTDKLLRKYLQARMNVSTETGALFISQSGTRSRLTTRSMQRFIAQVGRMAGVENFSPHSFRHFFIQNMAKRGVPDALIALFVGHRTPHTISHYTKMNRADLESVYRREFQSNPEE